MINQIYYISWSTWREDPVDTPWDFWFLSNGSRYKLRSGSESRLRPDAHVVANAYESQDMAILEEIDTNFINDVKLIAFVEAEDDQLAKNSVQQFFPDAEFDKCVAVDVDTQASILALISHTVNQSKKKA
jgi:hypothetical protein